ncbi:MAG TPA: efflux transporter outer membrane subunit, partial [Burkholderiaceae bacterium]
MLAAGCAVGPDYRKPDAPLPVSWKLEEPWRLSTPSDSADKGPWWKRFDDATLDTLQAQAMAGSPTLAIANARLAQARATLAATSASRYPQLGLGARASRLKISANRPLTNYATANSSTVQNDFAISLNASYEIDLAGRVQRTVEGAAASAEQSAADLANTRLLLSAELASNYFNLRSTDIELDVLSRSIGLQRRALELVTARHDLGAVSGLDVAQQQALLETTLTQVDVLRKQRAQYEHALATLTGTPAPSFSLPVDLREIRPPAVPLGVPSEILQRRPDVASAERAMAAANAQIGVATAAFYPSFVISPTVGVDSRMIETLFNGPSLLWSVGVSATQVLFDGGRIRANVDFSKAGYEATVANYRRVVLQAMQEAQDGITGLAALDRASTQSLNAVASARRLLEMSAARYEGGAANFLDVITAQQALLDNTLTQVDVLKRQRGLYQDAIATLVGTPAPGFELAPDITPLVVPPIPL